jgi:hypothetical protein
VSRRYLVLALAAFALPATAQTFDFPALSSAAACISVANARYRVARPDESADYTVRLDPAAAAPDVRIQLTSSIDAADFVLIEDEQTTAGCGADSAAQATRTIRIDPAATAPDLTIGLVNDDTAADYRIYLRGSALAPEAAAALFAAAQIASRPNNKIESTALTLR